MSKETNRRKRAHEKARETDLEAETHLFHAQESYRSIKPETLIYTERTNRIKIKMNKKLKIKSNKENLP